MTSTSDIRDKFLNFFAERGHQIVASSPLVPGNDKTLLFTNAGMVQFKDVFTGEDRREYSRATTSQRCVRAGGKHNDLDNVGYTARHHTFFEMLGNFSFGDYFKEEAIQYAWDFLTDTLALPKDKLWITVFEEDDEAESIWINKIGVPSERVIRIGAKDNFWMMGDTGPCGPCSEIFYDHGADIWGGPPGTPEEDGDRFIEIWNLVFMQFDRAADGTMNPLPKPSVDTGMGLERMAAVLQHVHNNYEIDLFDVIIKRAAAIIGTKDLANPSLKVVADHIRSCAFMITDGVLPGNEGRGYVLRRIIRRAVRHGHKLGATEAFFHRLVEPLLETMGEAYPELVKSAPHVSEQLLLEEKRFEKTLTAGLAILEGEIKDLSGTTVPGSVLFKMYDTYGFPVDLTADIARERDLTVDNDGFEVHMEAQRARAKAGSNFNIDATADIKSTATTTFLGYADVSATAVVVELYADGKPANELNSGQNGVVVLDQTPFYAESGGQVGDTGQLTTNDGASVEVVDTQKHNKAFLHNVSVVAGSLKVGDSVESNIDVHRRNRICAHHSATHLLHGALREVLGHHVEQRGSLVNDKQLRFDFSHTGPINDDDKVRIEQWMDEQVRRNSACTTDEMDMQQALDAGAMALFGEKYGSRVRVVTLGDRSVELCGGTHVLATGDLGAVRLVSESGIASGVRRIEAVSGDAALNHAQSVDATLRQCASMLKTSPNDLVGKLEQTLTKQKELAREVEQLSAKLSSQAGKSLSGNAQNISGASFLAQVVPGADAKALRTVVDQLRQDLPKHVVLLAGEQDGKVSLVTAVSKDLHQWVKAGDLMKLAAAAMGGRGGGRPDLAQGGADSLENIDQAITDVRNHVTEKLGAA